MCRTHQLHVLYLAIIEATWPQHIQNTDIWDCVWLWDTRAATKVVDHKLMWSLVDQAYYLFHSKGLSTLLFPFFCFVKLQACLEEVSGTYVDIAGKSLCTQQVILSTSQTLSACLFEFGDKLRVLIPTLGNIQQTPSRLAANTPFKQNNVQACSVLQSHSLWSFLTFIDDSFRFGSSLATFLLPPPWNSLMLLREGSPWRWHSHALSKAHHTAPEALVWALRNPSLPAHSLAALSHD